MIDWYSINQRLIEAENWYVSNKESEWMTNYWPTIEYSMYLCWVLPNLSTTGWMGHKVNFKQSTTDLNSEFSFY